MPTTNVKITNAWSQVAAATDTAFLITFDSENAIVEFATTAANSAPTVKGHRLADDEALTRDVIGAGYLWARTVPGLKPNGVMLVVTK